MKVITFFCLILLSSQAVRADPGSDVANANCELLLFASKYRSNDVLRSDVVTYLDGFQFGLDTMFIALQNDAEHLDQIRAALGRYETVCKENPRLSVGEVIERLGKK